MKNEIGFHVWIFNLLNFRCSLSVSRARPLAQVSLKTAQSANDITGTPITPTRSSGIVNKAIDLFFGW